MRDKIIKRTNLMDIVIQCIKDESPIIRGWARTSLYFAKRVCAIVDPKTNDNTVKILEDEFPEIEIYWQDRSLGDSDEDSKGERGDLITHGNLTKYINMLTEEDDWILLLAADERFHPNDFKILEEEIKEMKRLNEKNAGLVHRIMFDFIDDEQHYIKFHPEWINQSKFFKRQKIWLQHPGTHKGRVGHPINTMISKAPFYHYSHILPHKPKYSWSYTDAKTCDFTILKKENNGQIPKLRYNGPEFKDWMEMGCLLQKNTDKINITEQKIIKKIKNEKPKILDNIESINFKKHSCYDFVKDKVKNPILNVGAGKFKFEFEGKIVDTLDMTQNCGNILFVENLLEKKREENSYKTILLLNVLEHTPHPLEILIECKRILIDGGQLIISVPFICPKHDMPSDYWRFSDDGLKILCRKAGLKFKYVEKYFEFGNKNLLYYRGIFIK